MSSTHLLTVGEAADRLRMPAIRLSRMAKAGEIPSVCLPDGDLRFDHDDLSEWVGQFRRPARAAATNDEHCG